MPLCYAETYPPFHIRGRMLCKKKTCGHIKHCHEVICCESLSVLICLMRCCILPAHLCTYVKAVDQNKDHDLKFLKSWVSYYFAPNFFDTIYLWYWAYKSEFACCSMLQSQRSKGEATIPSSIEDEFTFNPFMRVKYVPLSCTIKLFQLLAPITCDVQCLVIYWASSSKTALLCSGLW